MGMMFNAWRSLSAEFSIDLFDMQHSEPVHDDPNCYVKCRQSFICQNLTSNL